MMDRESKERWESVAKGYQMVIDGYRLIAETKGHWEGEEAYRLQDAEWQLKAARAILQKMEEEGK